MKKVFTEIEILKLIKSGAKEIVVSKNDLLTPLALDRIKHSGMKVIRGGNTISDPASSKLKILIGSDHTGIRMKKIVVEFLKSKSYEVLDIGTYNEDPVDYPDIASNVAYRVVNKEFDLGIILDATGIPSAITANKVPGIRAATCYNEFSAKSSREHNDSNILVLGAKALGEETIKSIVDVWLKSAFLGDRHQRRLDKIKNIEDKFSKRS
ncbi:MAG TPA: ribose 5-phosphate isomerase B [Melioribacteraceae bacterium]|nr:ribose 5-phosphate isomerase B [Melioribacteraceae bacterium]